MTGYNVTKLHVLFFSSRFMTVTTVYNRVSLLHNFEVPPSNITSDGNYRDLGSVHFSYVSHSVVVSVVMRLRARRFRVQVPVEAREFSLLRNVKNNSVANTASSSKVTGVISQEQSGRSPNITTCLHLVPVSITFGATLLYSPYKLS